MLYVTALSASRPEFVAVWLAMKVAGVLSDSRSAYNIFLIGNGLNLGFAFLGAFVIDALQKGEVYAVVLNVAAVLAATILYTRWIKAQAA